jgi:putative DNA primase/helicase
MKTKINNKDLVNFVVENKELIELTKKFVTTVNYSKLSKSGNFVAGIYSEKVLEDIELAYDEYGRFWIYDSDQGIWLENAEKDLNKILREEYLEEKHQKKYYVDEVIEDIKGRVFKRGYFKEPNPKLIPFNDKIYNLENGELIEYLPEYFFIGKLPVNIDTENTDCPTIERIFGELLGERDNYVLYQLAAYCLYRSYPYQKAFFLVGEGRNGKTTYINILTKLVGEDNVSSVNLRDLLNKDFYLSQLYGKLLNNCGEIDENILRNTSILKQLTGSDIIVAQKKFKEPFKFRNYAKILIATNKLPETLDKSPGFYRRVRIIEFPFKFDIGINAIASIENKIPDIEFEGLAKKCVRILKDLYDNGFTFKENKSIEQATQEYEDASNPLSLFLKEKTENDANGKISCKKLAMLFSSYLADRKIEEWTPIRIGRALKDKGFEIRTLGVKKKDGERTTRKFWIGLKLK